MAKRSPGQSRLVAGPIESFSRGFTIGSRFKAIHAAAETRKLQNALLEKQIGDYDSDRELERLLSQSKLDSDKESKLFRRAQLEEFLALRGDRKRRSLADVLIAEEEAVAAQERGGLTTEKLPPGVMGPPATTRGPSFQEQQERRVQKKADLEVDAKENKIVIDLLRGSLPGASVLDDLVYTKDEALTYVQTELLPQINIKTGKDYDPEDIEVQYFATQHHAMINKELLDARQEADRTEALAGHRAAQIAQADERIRQTQLRMDKQANDLLRIELRQLAAREKVARKGIADIETRFIGGGDSEEGRKRIKQLKAPHVKDLTEILKRQDRLLGKDGKPKVGDVESGYRYKGGDPGDSKNWERVKK